MELEKLSPERIFVDLFLIILKRLHKIQADEQSITHKQITKNIEHLFERTIKARELLYAGNIDEDDYVAIKSDCEKKINTMGVDFQKAILATIEWNKNGSKEVGGLIKIDKLSRPMKTIHKKVSYETKVRTALR